MTELERMKWQIYFSNLTERTNWKTRKMGRERIRVTNTTNLKLA
jgi:hypothetical protein